jgi:quinoprotein glucose dehydrogenase
MSRQLLALPALALLASLAATAVPPEDPKAPPPPKGSPGEALLAVQVDPKLKVTVWAAEPLMMNPVAFCFDEKGRAYVAETTRFHNGVPDTRGHMKWLDEDLAARTVADRLKMYEKHNYKGFEKFDDHVRMVWDSTGGGKADKSSIFAGGFNQLKDGLGAGVLARKGNVYFTCIPDLWVLKDTKGENKADVKTSLSTGYGVRAQFLGHDLHGLRMGPDGKLYFSIGDRGFTVKTKEGKTLSNPDSGAVLRCEPDGRNLEIVHTGLRNPQELAFDDHGNLFTYDNNCDAGDRARWVHIVEGGDSGWRAGYQYDTDFYPPGKKDGNRGPWKTEKIWEVAAPGTDNVAYIVPPLAHFGNGPSGITHYPGVGLNDKYKDHFFACDFTSNAGNSVIWSLSVKPKGASFEVSKPEPFVKGMVPTDCEFGPDGAFYWSDWTGGWNPPNKGRIFRLTDPEAMKNPAVAEAQKLLAEGMEKRSAAELAKLLEHPHQMVRFEAQYELTGRYTRETPKELFEAVMPAVVEVLKTTKSTTARLHALWALQRILRTNRVREVVDLVYGFSKDLNPVIRAQVARMIGLIGPGRDEDDRAEPEKRRARTLLQELIADPDAGVGAAALVAYSRVGPALGYMFPTAEQDFYAPFFERLKLNNDADAYLRHAAVMALTNAVRNPTDLFNAWKLAKAKYDTPAVRLGVLLALRRHHSEKCAEFLTDDDARIVAEAARAIHDERIFKAFPALTDLTKKSGLADAVSFRALSACFKLGSADVAKLVAEFAARKSEPDHVRAFALKLLGDWANPPRRDHVTGLVHDLPKGEITFAADALRPHLVAVFAAPDVVRTAATQASTKLGIKEVGPLMTALVKDTAAPVGMRAEAFGALVSLKDAVVPEMTAFALASPEPRLRAAGRAAKAKTAPAVVLAELPALLKDEKAALVEKQGAFAILAGMSQSAETDKLLAEWLDAAAAGKVPAELLLDVLDAAEVRTSAKKLKLTEPLKAKLDAYRASQAKSKDKLAAWSESLAGGDAENGRSIFLNNAAVYCQRCHRLDNVGGDVGPQLNGIAAEPGKDRRYLLEAITLPSAQIAKGFESVVLVLADGRPVTGVLKSEDKKQLKVMTAEAKEIIVSVDDIESRRTGLSAMPDDLHKKLTRRELRDVVEFLAGLKEPLKK